MLMLMRVDGQGWEEEKMGVDVKSLVRKGGGEMLMLDRIKLG